MDFGTSGRGCSDYPSIPNPFHEIFSEFECTVSSEKDGGTGKEVSKCQPPTIITTRVPTRPLAARCTSTKVVELVLIHIRDEYDPRGDSFRGLLDGLLGNGLSQLPLAATVHAILKHASITRHRECLRKLASAVLSMYVDQHRRIRDEILRFSKLGDRDTTAHDGGVAIKLPTEVMPVLSTNKKHNKTLEKRWFAEKRLGYAGPLATSAMSAPAAYTLLLRLWERYPDTIRIPSDEYLIGDR
jgi:hypothetical protein